MSRVHSHYDNLKVSRDAPPEVIRAAYRSLCHKFHPDRNAGSPRATRAFQLISSAYEVLSDPQARRQHDDWIAREESAVPAWDGRERRSPRPRKPAPSLRRRLGKLGSGLRAAHKAVLLWTSAVVVGAMLVVLYSD